jgi:hypothetical protein
VTAETRRSRAELVAEAVATGCFLGFSQVALGFALLTGAGASALIFFALTATWLAGGALFAAVVPARVLGPSGLRLLAIAIAALASARAALSQWPYDARSTLMGLLAGLLAGGYAGHFLRDRAPLWGSARPLLLHENNGFVAGIAGGGALLLVSTRALDAATISLGAALLVAQVRSAARHG